MFLAITTKARTVVEGGKKDPLSDRGSELRLGREKDIYKSAKK